MRHYLLVQMKSARWPRDAPELAPLEPRAGVGMAPKPGQIRPISTGIAVGGILSALSTLWYAQRDWVERAEERGHRW